MIATEEEAYEAMLAHHRTLDGEVKLRAQAVKNAAFELGSYELAVSDLISYINIEVIPHAVAEEYSIYQIAKDKLGLDPAIKDMTAEHKLIIDAIKALEDASTGSKAAQQSEQIASLFSNHVAKENDVILPKLLLDPSVDLVKALEEMHELFEAAQQSASSPQKEMDEVASLFSLLLDATKALAQLGLRDKASQLTASAWAILQTQRPELANKATVALHRLVDSGTTEPVSLSTTHHHKIDSELDVRSLPPAQRHSAIFAQYRALSPGGGFMLINDHDPKPLKYQFEAEYPGQFSWDYLESGPKTWRVRIGYPSR